MAFIDLDIALLQILRDTLEYLSQKEKTIDSITEKTYQFYLNEAEKDKLIKETDSFE